MVMVNAFRGVRYNPNVISDYSAVLAPPYDVISPSEQDELYERNPYNVVRLELTKGDSDEKYAEAGQTFRNWIAGEVLIRDREPCIYPYYQEFEEDGETMCRKGFIAAVKLEEFSSKKILPHELTFPKHKQDRLKLTTACEANLSPVFAIYSDPEGAIEESIEQKLSEKPIVEAVNKEGVKNKLWKISDTGLISETKRRMLDSNLLIADGHHRYETALEYRSLKRRTSGADPGDKPYDYVLMYLSRAEGEGLIIKPTHRVLKSLGSLSEEEFLKRLNDRFNLQKVPFGEGISSLGHREFVLVTKEPDFVFKLSSKKQLSISYDNLGVMLLHKLVFRDIIKEEEAQILYTKSTEEVVNLVQRGEYKLGVILPHISPLDIFEVSMAGEKMPHKTTYFYPKLLTGLVFHLLD